MRLPSIGWAQACASPTLMLAKVPGGAIACPLSFEPQHESDASAFSPQA